MDGIQRLGLLFLILLQFYACHALIIITSPTSTIIPGSIVEVSWIDLATNPDPINFTLNIRLVRYSTVDTVSSLVPEGMPITATLESNIIARNTPCSVHIPEDLYANFRYVITLVRKETQIASSPPLIVLPKTLKIAHTASQSETDTLSTKENDSSLFTDILSVRSVSPSSASSNTHQQVSGEDLGPTLTSNQVANIAMSIVGCAGVIYVFYFFIKWIYEKRKLPSMRQSIWDDTMTASSENDNFTNQTNTTTHHHHQSDGRNTVNELNTSSLESIHEEESNRFYDGQYYGQFFSSTTGNLTSYQSDTPSLRVPNSQKNRERPSSPFGEAPAVFNGNRYEQLPLPPLPTAYSQSKK